MKSAVSMRGQPVPSGNWSVRPVWGSGMPGTQSGNKRKKGMPAMMDARQKNAPAVGADIPKKKRSS